MNETIAYDRIETALLDWIRNEIYDPSVGIQADTNLIHAGLDSFSLLKILVFIEKTFSLRVPETDVNEERMQSVENIARLIHELLEYRKSSV